MVVTVEAAPSVDHRIDAARVDFVDVVGARRAGELREIGRTTSLVLQPERPTYQLRYRADVAPARSFRCPVWLPDVATDGIARRVTLSVELPPGAMPGDAMPSLAWTGTRGVATLGHLPAFVHVPFGAAGAAPGWGIGATMDAVGAVVIVLSVALWIWRWKR